MQITLETNSDGLPDFPMDLPVQDVNVFVHDSGMFATHDYSCPCCRTKHAILDLSTGLMQPCIECSETYRIVKVKKPKKRIWIW